MNLDTERLRTLAEARAFLYGSDPAYFRAVDRDDPRQALHNRQHRSVIWASGEHPEPGADSLTGD